MPKSNADYENEFLADLKKESGRDLKTWMNLARKSGHEKHNAVLNFFKKEHGFNHMQANFLAAIFRNDGKPVYGDLSSLLDEHFKGRDELRPIYDTLAQIVGKKFRGVEIVPVKGYVSFRNPREFAVAKITRKTIRVGMDLGDRKFAGRVEKAKSLGTMPRISHMVEVTDGKEIDAELETLLAEADGRVNAK